MFPAVARVTMLAGVSLVLHHNQVINLLFSVSIVVSDVWFRTVASTLYAGGADVCGDVQM
jgi:type IV secretory pathway VirB3-like protein